MATEHSTLTGSNLHEPKGVASATSGQVYVANGSGSGAWTSRVQTGFWDYNDVTTTGTPITITGGAGFVALTNDGAGAFTNKTYALAGMTDIYNTSTNKFDWDNGTGLSLGDTVELRVDVDIIVASVNTEVDIALELADGTGSDYDIPFVNSVNFKNTGTFKNVTYSGIYMGDTDTLNNPAFFKMQADKTCTVTVNGWYVRATTR